ncbi:MAG TPA: alcohol dehydrogenase [Bacteroidales bacterium]|nr:alcohol dehydrogenase [Bacteroidales bacterium]HBZ21017.1 alcohol dehydrogenase [Bacteroidales bacterium]
MVKAFQFSRLPFIHFSTGKIKVLPGLIKRYGKTILLVTAGESFVKSPYAETLSEALLREGIKYLHFVVSGEPSPEIIDSVSEKIRNEAVNAVVAVGGGSVLDAGKAVSAMYGVKGSVREYLEGVGTWEHPGTKLPFIALPTTSGTGSEATKNAVISEIGKNGFKKSLRHDNFVPDIAIVDPELTLSCPPDITAASGMDCFTQLTESFLSGNASEYTDALAWEGLKAVKSSLVQTCHNGDDITARTGMSFAALTSGICLANAGLGVVHGFASSAGGMFNIPHGVVCGTLMAPANAITLRELRRGVNNPEITNKYVRLGKLFIETRGKPDDYYMDGFVEYLLKLSDDLNLPRLDKYGIKEEDIEPICRITELKNNPVKLNLEDLMEILRSRL